ncbi:MAG: hypothetical protein OEZ32_14615, partial [Nitrospinota bacterium]|nr:hypothetical protein [Nitrospinota bacterium]
MKKVDHLDWYHSLVTRMNTIRDEEELKNALDTLLEDILVMLKAREGAIRVWPVDKKSTVRSQTSTRNFKLCFDQLDAPECVCSHALASGKMAARRELTVAVPPPGSPCALLGAETIICGPVATGGDAGGIFTAILGYGAPEGGNAKAPDNQSLKLVSIALTSLGHALDNLMDRRRDEAMARDMETVNYIGGLIAGKLTLKEMVREIVSRLGQVLETDEVNVIAYDQEREELSFLASYFHGGSALDRPEVYPLSDGMNSW